MSDFVFACNGDDNCHRSSRQLHHCIYHDVIYRVDRVCVVFSLDKLEIQDDDRIMVDRHFFVVQLFDPRAQGNSRAHLTIRDFPPRRYHRDSPHCLDDRRQRMPQRNLCWRQCHRCGSELAEPRSLIRCP